MVSQITVLTVIAMAGVATSCVCPMVYSPVCGSNGQTFSNKCMLNCHNAETKDNLSVVSRGHCRKTLQMNKEFVQQNPDDRCLCTKEYVPVCGSNLKTYANMCVFNCAAKKENGLRVLYPMVCIIMP